MLGPEEEGKISHVTEIEISERSTEKKLTDEGPPEVYTPYIKIFKEVFRYYNRWFSTLRYIFI